MKTFNLFKAITLALACAGLAITTTTPAEAGVIKAHAGTTFVLTPAGGVGRPDCLESIGVASNATPGLRSVEIDGSGQFTEEKEVQRTR